MAMQHVDETTINCDLAARVNYLKSFIRFTPEDGDAIRSAKPIIAPAVPEILNDIYTHLISFDITAKSFVPRQPEQTEADVAAQHDQPQNGETNLQDLTLNHPNIVHRKDFLRMYLLKLVNNGDWSDGSMFWDYMDKVGVMHTGQPGFKHREKRPQLRVEVMHMSLLLGYVEDIVLKAVMGAEGVDASTKTNVIRAFNKVLWIQNDLFQRHYVADRPRPSAM